MWCQLCTGAKPLLTTTYTWVGFHVICSTDHRWMFIFFHICLQEWISFVSLFFFLSFFFCVHSKLIHDSLVLCTFTVSWDAASAELTVCLTAGRISLLFSYWGNKSRDHIQLFAVWIFMWAVSSLNWGNSMSWTSWERERREPAWALDLSLWLLNLCFVTRDQRYEDTLDLLLFFFLGLVQCCCFVFMTVKAALFILG